MSLLNQAIWVLWFISVGFMLIQFITLISNLFFFPKLQRFSTIDWRPKISLLIPVRNEIDNLPETLSGILAQEREYLEIIVLDDESTDGSSAYLQTYQEQNSLRVITGQPILAGWGGKNWACHQLSQAATGDILIFTDADVFWEKDTLDSLLYFMQKQEADFVSVWPKQLTKTFFERLTVPIIDNILLGWLPYLGVAHISVGAFSAGNGQLMMWRRDCYEKVGGHEAFKAEVLEDVRMGQAAKGAGSKVALAVGGELISTRMYRNREDVLNGFSKNILQAHNSSRIFLILSVFMTSLSSSFSWLLAFINPLWLLPALLSLAVRFLSCFKTGRNLWELSLQALVCVPLIQIAWRALSTKGAYVWKARQYS